MLFSRAHRLFAQIPLLKEHPILDWRVFLTTFGAVFLAELGDKTQLACMMLTAKSGRPWTVFMATSLALVLVSLLGVVLADFLCNYISPPVIKKVAAVGFIVVGGLIYFDKL
jgi:putative Ca2+/H+ antiporter (TMEM165/GDT1 family)